MSANKEDVNNVPPQNASMDKDADITAEAAALAPPDLSPARKGLSEHVAEPVHEPVAEPAAEPVAEPVDESVAESDAELQNALLKKIAELKHEADKRADDAFNTEKCRQVVEQLAGSFGLTAPKWD